MSDAFMVLAQAKGGLSCFLLPRYLPDGSANGIHLTRLKDQLGSRSSATAEAELSGSQAWLVGEEGQGAELASEMLLYTRLDHAVVAAGLMRSGLANAIHYAEHRIVSGRKLAREPLMMQVLADIALDVEAAVALTFRLARAFDRMSDTRAAAWCHLMTPVTKYWVSKIAQWAVAEALECLGGEGYVEEMPLARIARDLPCTAIVDGPGNVMALEVLAVLRREPEYVSLVMEDLGRAAAGDAGLEAAHARIETMLQEPRWLDQRARALTESLAVLAAGTILRAHVPAAVADAFITTRALHAIGRTYGQGDRQRGRRSNHRSGTTRQRPGRQRRLVSAGAGRVGRTDGGNDARQRTHERVSLRCRQRRQDTLIRRAGGRHCHPKRAFALVGQPHGVHAGITPRAAALHQSARGEPAHDVGHRRTINPGFLHEVRLARLLAVGDSLHDRKLPRGEAGVADVDGEQLVGTLAGPVKQVERRGEPGSLIIEFHVRRALGFELAERIDSAAWI